MKVSIGESVGYGHPDKICDQVADLVLDTLLELDSSARVACEVMLFDHKLTISGEVNCDQTVKLKWQPIVEERVRTLLLQIMSSPIKVTIRIECHNQSQELSDVVGANDQCVVTGYATSETKNMLPLAQVLAHELLQEINHARQYLPPFKSIMADMKSLIWISYEPSPINVQGTISVQHQKLSLPAFKALKQKLAEQIIKPVLKKHHLSYQSKNWTINNAGRWENGGTDADTGVTGRKIIIDCYGPTVVHGGGAFSGKDISKIDRLGAYFCRYVAKNIVSAGLAERCLVQMAFHIGGQGPINIKVNTFGTARHYSDRELVAGLEVLNRSPDYDFSFKTGDILQRMKLSPPYHYRKLAVYGHFGRLDLPNMPWEALNRQFIRDITKVLSSIHTTAITGNTAKC